jgi:hypothetical protein
MQKRAATHRYGVLAIDSLSSPLRDVVFTAYADEPGPGPFYNRSRNSLEMPMIKPTTP